jgi:hypothetical protein
MQRHGWALFHHASILVLQCLRIPVLQFRTHLRFVTRPSPLGTLAPKTSAARATLHLPLATFS